MKRFIRVYGLGSGSVRHPGLFCSIYGILLWGKKLAENIIWGRGLAENFRISSYRVEGFKFAQKTFIWYL